MKRLLSAAAVSALLLSGAAAEAAKRPSPRAKVFNATIAGTGSAYSAVSGKAQMVDNKRRDSAKIQIRGLLNPGSVYYWTIYKVNAGKGACDPGAAGQGVEAFRYKDLRVNAAGNASVTVRSKKLVTYTTTRYAVAVSDDNGTVACGELKQKRGGKKPRA